MTYTLAAFSLCPIVILVDRIKIYLEGSLPPSSTEFRGSLRVLFGTLSIPGVILAYILLPALSQPRLGSRFLGASSPASRGLTLAFVSLRISAEDWPSLVDTLMASPNLASGKRFRGFSLTSFLFFDASSAPLFFSFFIFFFSFSKNIVPAQFCLLLYFLLANKKKTKWTH